MNILPAIIKLKFDGQALDGTQPLETSTVEFPLNTLLALGGNATYDFFQKNKISWAYLFKSL